MSDAGTETSTQTSTLPRVLRRFALFAVAFSIVSITTGIFVNYGYGLTQLGPAAVWLWPVVVVGQFLLTLVLAELAGHVPLAGAAYQWAARLVGPRFGYVVGALGIVYTAVGVPGIMLVGMAPLTATVLGLDTTDGRLLVFFAVLAVVVAYVLNIVRVQLAAQVNNVAVFAEIIGTVVLSAVVFFAWVQGGAGTPDGGHGLRLPVHRVDGPADRRRAGRRRAGRHLHPRRLRGRRGSRRGGRRRPALGAPGDDRLGAGVRCARHGRAGRVHRRDPRPAHRRGRRRCRWP